MSSTAIRTGPAADKDRTTFRKPSAIARDEGACPPGSTRSSATSSARRCGAGRLPSDPSSTPSSKSVNAAKDSSASAQLARAVRSWKAALPRCHDPALPERGLADPRTAREDDHARSPRRPERLTQRSKLRLTSEQLRFGFDAPHPTRTHACGAYAPPAKFCRYRWSSNEPEPVEGCRSPIARCDAPLVPLASGRAVRVGSSERPCRRRGAMRGYGRVSRSSASRTLDRTFAAIVRARSIRSAARGSIASDLARSCRRVTTPAASASSIA